MMKLKNAAIVAALPITDMERAKRFYGETLELDLCEESEERGELLYEAGNGTHVLVYQRPTPTQADHTAMAFIVDDLEATMDQLRNKGIMFEEYDMPGLKTVDGVATVDGEKGAWFKDPEGNILGVTESEAGSRILAGECRLQK
jgi:predicted enzyme related to lactoylglutathione lyase